MRFIFKVSSVLFATLTMFSQVSMAATGIEQKGEFLCSQLNPNPSFIYDQHFEEGFRTVVSYEDVVGIFKSFAERDGSCTSWSVNSTDGVTGHLIITTDQGAKYKWPLRVTDSAPYLIGGLRVTARLNPRAPISSFMEIRQRLEAFSGETAAEIVIFGAKDHILFEKNRTDRSLTGSEFKLYILGALAEKVKNSPANWTDDLAIRDDLKSFPSGVMQDFPTGENHSLQYFATQMISRSDNTATDHLLDFVGRRSVEQILTPRINSFVEENKPFHSTMDFFRLKAMDSSVVDDYLALPTSEKYQRLETLAAEWPREKVAPLLDNWEMPRRITDLEWFASRRDLCQTMKWLDSMDGDHNGTVRSVLGANTPFIDLEEHRGWFRYAGFKGGSEPGVVASTYLIEFANGTKGCISLSNFNPDAPVDSDAFFDLLHAIVHFTGSEMSSPALSDHRGNPGK